MELLKKDKITSLELLEQINIFRKQEGNRAELQHKTLLEIIRDEFSDEIDRQKILPIFYKDKYGREQPMFELTYKQAVQVLVKESKFVRKSVINYMEQLETRVKQLERKKGKYIRKLETDAIKTLLEYGKIPKEKSITSVKGS